MDKKLRIVRTGGKLKCAHINWQNDLLLTFVGSKVWCKLIDSTELKPSLEVWSNDGDESSTKICTILKKGRHYL